MKAEQRFGAVLAGLLWLMMGSSRMAQSQERIFFDWAGKPDAQGWQAQHDIAALTPTPDGLKITITSNDPYLVSPPRLFPVGQPLWLTVKLKAERAGLAQVFYFSESGGPDEIHSVRFTVKGGGWETLKIPMPPLGPKSRLRFDPPGDRGDVLLASMEFTTRTIYPLPEFPKPAPLAPPEKNNSVTSGNLTLRFNGKQAGGFFVEVGGVPMATGWANAQIGYLKNEKLHWLDLTKTDVVGMAGTVKGGRAGSILHASATDEDGGKWEFDQISVPGRVPNTIDIEISVISHEDRQILFLPMLTLLAGAGSFGESKQQAIFGGLEYLDKDEPSRSEADIIGPEAQRQLPENYKITLPLMAVQQNGCYVGLTWDGDTNFSALFDSPDRTLHSGGHLMSLVFPGAPSGGRASGAILPYSPVTLLAYKREERAKTRLVLRCTLLGGKGSSLVPAIQQAVAVNKLPALPKPFSKWDDAARLLAAGYLDSALGKDGTFKHALPGSFPFQWAADAGVWLDYLATQTTDNAFADRMKTAAKQAIAPIPREQLNFAGVGHVRYPVPSLIYGATAENVERAARAGHDLLTRFAPDGTIAYHKPADGVDLGRTHFAPDANGLTAQVVATVLECAKFSGDKSLLTEGLQVLHGLDKFANTVPRGAQTWEVPLHTPDILASAYLVRAYTLGYELSGDTKLLDAAKYWAWTGVPFVYLRNPTEQAVGPYATIAVLGATQWVAPNWMGLPVQWCGMVYADALRSLAKFDSNTLWTTLADGITASGLQQTFPFGSDKERVGLLPDSFNLAAQVRNDPAINPGTVLSGTPGLYKRTPLYDSFVSRKTGLIVHAPGRITDVKETAKQLTFKAEGWPVGEYEILLVGLTHTPTVHLNGQEIALAPPHSYDAKTGRLILHVKGQPTIQIALQAE